MATQWRCRNNCRAQSKAKPLDSICIISRSLHLVLSCSCAKSRDSLSIPSDIINSIACCAPFGPHVKVFNQSKNNLLVVFNFETKNTNHFLLPPRQSLLRSYTLYSDLNIVNKDHEHKARKSSYHLVRYFANIRANESSSP